MPPLARPTLAAALLCAVALPSTAGCTDTPSTNVVFENGYPQHAAKPVVVYSATWVAATLPVPLLPGASSAPQATVPASANTAYAVLAPGWDPTSSSPPAELVALQSRGSFALDIDDTLQLTIDDTTFAGDCAAGSFLTEEQADFITQRVFQCDFAGLTYDAATCTTSGGSR